MTAAALPRSPRPRRAFVAAVVALVAVAGTGCTITEESSETEPAGPPPIIRFERDGYRLTYHVPSGSLSLFDLRSDPQCLRNLAPQMPDRVADMRRALEAELGVKSLEELQEHFSEHIQHLKELGYL